MGAVLGNCFQISVLYVSQWFFDDFFALAYFSGPHFPPWFSIYSHLSLSPLPSLLSLPLSLHLLSLYTVHSLYTFSLFTPSLFTPLLAQFLLGKISGGCWDRTRNLLIGRQMLRPQGQGAYSKKSVV